MTQDTHLSVVDGGPASSQLTPIDYKALVDAMTPGQICDYVPTIAKESDADQREFIGCAIDKNGALFGHELIALIEEQKLQDDIRASEAGC